MMKVYVVVDERYESWVFTSPRKAAKMAVAKTGLWYDIEGNRATVPRVTQLLRDGVTVMLTDDPDSILWKLKVTPEKVST